MKEKKDGEGNRGKCLEKENILLWRRRRTEREGEENILEKERFPDRSHTSQFIVSKTLEHLSDDEFAKTLGTMTAWLSC